MKFDMTEAWREAMAMFAANREVLLIVAGIFFLVPSLGLSLAIGDLQEMIIADPTHAEALMIEMYANWWWLLILVVLAQILGYLALLALLRDSARPTVGEALMTGLVGLIPAIGTYILLVVGLSLIFVLLVGTAGVSGSAAVGVIAVIVALVAFVYIGVKLSLSGPVIAIDRVFNPIMVFARSWKLTKGNSLRLLLFYFLIGIVYVVAGGLFSVVIAALTLAFGASTAQLLNEIASGFLSAAFTTVLVLVIAAAHRQLSGPSAAAVNETFE